MLFETKREIIYKGLGVVSFLGIDIAAITTVIAEECLVTGGSKLSVKFTSDSGGSKSNAIEKCEEIALSKTLVKLSVKTRIGEFLFEALAVYYDSGEFCFDMELESCGNVEFITMGEE